MKLVRSEGRHVAPPHVIDGSAVFELLSSGAEAAAIEALHVHFGPGARTRWHSHPQGQVLIVTEGTGWVEARGHEARSIRPGDVVYIDPHEEHWHGAAATAALSHIALQRPGEGDRGAVLEPVADEHYDSVAGGFS